MKDFISGIFGGKSPQALATAVTRTFIQGALGFYIAAPMVLDLTIEAHQAALGGGITAVIALLHGLVQDPQARQAQEEARYFAALDAHRDTKR